MGPFCKAAAVAEKITQQLSVSNLPPNGTWNSPIEICPLWYFGYICSVHQL
jgi:hypothetical protein